MEVILPIVLCAFGLVGAAATFYLNQDTVEDRVRRELGEVPKEKYCGPLSKTIGCFCFWPVFFCPVDKRERVAGQYVAGTVPGPAAVHDQPTAQQREHGMEGGGGGGDGGGDTTHGQANEQRGAAAPQAAPGADPNEKDNATYLAMVALLLALIGGIVVPAVPGGLMTVGRGFLKIGVWQNVYVRSGETEDACEIYAGSGGRRARRTALTSCPYPGRRFTTGDQVMLKPGAADREGALSQGEVGTIVQDDRDSQPYKVRGPGGRTSMYLGESEVQCPTSQWPYYTLAGDGNTGTLDDDWLDNDDGVYSSNYGGGSYSSGSDGGGSQTDCQEALESKCKTNKAFSILGVLAVASSLAALALGATTPTASTMALPLRAAAVVSAAFALLSYLIVWSLTLSTAEAEISEDATCGLKGALADRGYRFGAAFYFAALNTLFLASAIFLMLRGFSVERRRASGETIGQPYCGPLSWFTFCCSWACLGPFAWPIAWCPLDHRAVDPAQPAAADVPEEKYCGALSVLIGVCCCPLGLIAACFPVDRRQNTWAMGFQAGQNVHAMGFQAGQLHHQPRAAGHVQSQPMAHATNTTNAAPSRPRKETVFTRPGTLPPQEDEFNGFSMI